MLALLVETYSRYVGSQGITVFDLSTRFFRGFADSKSANLNRGLLGHQKLLTASLSGPRVEGLLPGIGGCSQRNQRTHKLDISTFDQMLKHSDSGGRTLVRMRLRCRPGLVKVMLAHGQLS